MDKNLSRRDFLKVAGAATVVTNAIDIQDAEAQTRREAAVAQQRAYTFFNAEEARCIEAAVARLIPYDELGPGALEAGVPNYIDKQLGGAWGAGERLYRSGPWQQGVPQQGYQLPFTPAELFRNALRGMRKDLLAKHQKSFENLSGDEQDAYLDAMQKQPHDLGDVPSNIFFESLLEMTIEGYFSDPVYGGNKDMAAWAMIGFPGAYANYYELVDQHNLKFYRKPMSLAENARGEVHVRPQIPAYARDAATTKAGK